MRGKMRAANKGAAGFGPVLARVRMDVKVHFALAEPQDIIDGVPDLEFTLGKQLFGIQEESQRSLLAPTCSSLVPAGGRIQTAILLRGTSALSVISGIKHAYICKADPAA